MSHRQADDLSILLKELGTPWNKHWNGGPVVAVEGVPEVELPGGMRITLLSPRLSELQRLDSEWDRLRERHMPESDGPPASETEVEESTDLPPLPSAVIFHAPQDLPHARDIHNRARAEIGTEANWDLWHGPPTHANVRVELDVEESIKGARVALVLLSPSILSSPGFMIQVLPVLVAAAEQGRLVLSWVLLAPCPWEKTVLARFQAAHDVSRALRPLRGIDRERTIGRIVGTVEALLAKGSHKRGSTQNVPIDVDALAAKAFVSDASVVNAASIAFLAEFHDRALLIGGDARDEVLIGSIQWLLARRKQQRLRVDAFVVPHNGSARNLSRPLLELLECDQYLFATDGSRFGHPSRETIARIIMYGRATPNSRPKLVFNYRTPFTQVWDDPALKARYGYEAFYPTRGDAGTTVHL